MEIVGIVLVSLTFIACLWKGISYTLHQYKDRALSKVFQRPIGCCNLQPVNNAVYEKLFSLCGKSRRLV